MVLLLITFLLNIYDKHQDTDLFFGHYYSNEKRKDLLLMEVCTCLIVSKGTMDDEICS